MTLKQIKITKYFKPLHRRKMPNEEHLKKIRNIAQTRWSSILTRVGLKQTKDQILLGDPKWKTFVSFAKKHYCEAFLQYSLKTGNCNVKVVSFLVLIDIRLIYAQLKNTLFNNFCNLHLDHNSGLKQTCAICDSKKIMVIWPFEKVAF